MKAAILEAYSSPLIVKEVQDPSLTPDGVIVKIEASGVCRSDWHIWAGHLPVNELPLILGHEIAGVVEEVGKDIKNFKKGDRVIIPFSQSDGVCPYCQAGHHNVCDTRTVVGADFNGGFASHIHIPRADLNLIALPDSISFLEASAMGCRFVTAFHGVMTQGRVRAGDWVSVYGSGGVGLSAIQIASTAGANVIAVDIGDDKLEMAKKFGAVHIVNSKRDNPVEAIKEITKGGSHVSIDALGITDTCVNSILSLTKKGRHVQIGASSNENFGATPIPINLVTVNEIEIVGSAGMPNPDYRTLLRMVETGRLNPGALVTSEISLEDINKTFEEMNAYAGSGMTVITKF
ncbi:alcohol dehydrogenase catalytic domain-containing protein [Paenibacillus sp. HJL G12]|uniref:Alcohol dehydrogenase catalytic domain-containing protein n=1 Tax=Paenibacillus dendrobii TaxID=2691084 RepID=A0A7X3IP33_9BACL|nr:zinc-dependent alcohol dehydrogenase family protein [Paenibacillus dendrobii]MWV46245.1 alcohol dehydrogenase catalytic domain-containing protein [Paenibacillus dendrobii]